MSIPISNVNKGGVVSLSFIDVDSETTFEFKPNSRQKLLFKNESESSSTLTIKGDSASTVDIPGIGSPVDVSSGFVFSISQGETLTIGTDSIKYNLLSSDGIVSVSSDSEGCYVTIIEG